VAWYHDFYKEKKGLDDKGVAVVGFPPKILFFSSEGKPFDEGVFQQEGIFFFYPEEFLRNEIFFLVISSPPPG